MFSANGVYEALRVFGATNLAASLAYGSNPMQFALSAWTFEIYYSLGA
jgi:hypothetical protein